MVFQNLNKNFKSYIFIVIFFTILLFLIGFFFQENSAGAGGFEGDFQHVWNNLSIFENNDFRDGLKATAGTGDVKYISSRTPLIYIFQIKMSQGLRPEKLTVPEISDTRGLGTRLAS